MTNRSSGTQNEEETKNDLEKALQYIDKQVSDLYLISIFRNQSPVAHGYPMMRPRWYASRLTQMHIPMILS